MLAVCDQWSQSVLLMDFSDVWISNAATSLSKAWRGKLLSLIPICSTIEWVGVALMLWICIRKALGLYLHWLTLYCTNLPIRMDEVEHWISFWDPYLFTFLDVILCQINSTAETPFLNNLRINQHTMLVLMQWHFMKCIYYISSKNNYYEVAMPSSGILKIGTNYSTMWFVLWSQKMSLLGSGLWEWESIMLPSLLISSSEG
jgi:hypothetical protein